MIVFTEGNLLESGAEALVNTVNTVGIMGKGIALMFKEAFPDNFKAYAAACKRGDVRLCRMFVTERSSLIGGPKWIVNFPTKEHWRASSKIEWVECGLQDLRRFVIENNITSIALPPLGSGNGGLDWQDVRPLIESALSSLSTVKIFVYQPTATYRNVAKREGVEVLSPARALVAELVRRYWILGFECTLLEVQKLAYFLERNIDRMGLPNPLHLTFRAEMYGPYASRLTHLLNGLDGSYLHCDKRIADAGPLDIIRFDDAKKDRVAAYLQSKDAKIYRPALEETAALIDGFESPLGMELLATVDWLISQRGTSPTAEAIATGLKTWSGGPQAAARKQRLFDDRLIRIALRQLINHGSSTGTR